MLQVKNLSLRRQVNEKIVSLVEAVSFVIRSGETFCLVGESGSGKSLSALSLMRLLPEDTEIELQGQILFQGKDQILTDLTALDDRQYNHWRGSRIAMIFQEPMSSLNPVMTIGEQVGEAVLLANPECEEDDLTARVLELLRAVHIPHAEQQLEEYPHRLSGGQRQRVMIAIALAGDPELLIADEPTTALDVTIQAGIIDLLCTLQRERHMAMLFITHDLGLVAHIADRVAVMHKGRIVESGKAQQIIHRPENPYTRSLLQSLPENLPDFRVDQNVDRADSDAKATLLSVENLCVDYATKSAWFWKSAAVFNAVQNVSMDLSVGEILALVGESGCGKTTLGRTILRLLKPSSGKILFKGKAFQQMSADELKSLPRKMQIVFQDSVSAINPRLTLAATMTEPMKVHKIGHNQRSRLEIAANLFREVQLDPDMLTRFPHQLSGGQRQRAGIARALLLNPDFIVCDEVTSALDVSVQARVLELLLRLREERRLSLLFITHDISVVEYVSDRTAVMYKGQVVESGVTEQVCREPQNEYTRQLLSAAPRIGLS